MTRPTSVLRQFVFCLQPFGQTQSGQPNLDLTRYNPMLVFPELKDYAVRYGRRRIDRLYIGRNQPDLFHQRLNRLYRF